MLKMIPFAQKHGLIVQQDGASCYIALPNQQLLYDSKVKVLEWCSNLPDLNMIEPAWPYTKRETYSYLNCETKSELLAIWYRI